MQHKEGTFKGLNGLELYHVAWLPDKEIKAVIIAVHGLAEHIGRYKNVVDYLIPRGYAIYGLDHRGHGKSQGIKGYVDRFDDYITDLKTFHDMVRKEQPDKKIFMLGHSLGGLIAVAYAVKYQEGLAGLIASAPLLKIGASVSPATVFMAKIIAALAPKMGVTTLDASAISRDQAVVDTYVNDPLVYRGKTSARLGVELIEITTNIPEMIPTITLPLLVMYGTEDRLCDPEGSKMLYYKAGSMDKTLKAYEGLYHEIFNEPEHEAVLADVEVWLSTRV
jgi:alpha-beta hydrolase superfamily lysophospholipase